jgi:hypothetical protein
MDDGKPPWDEAFGAALIGSVVLIGITRISGQETSQEQFFGTVVRADAGGIELLLGGSRSGERYVLPPDPRNFFPAESGTYRLTSTGEEVRDPDFTSTWTVHSGED